jgi:hypothetical protein
VEERKGEGVDSTQAEGTQGMAEQTPEYPEPRVYSREFKLEAMLLS